MQPIMRQSEQFPDSTDHFRVAGDSAREQHENPWHHETSEDAFYYEPPEMQHYDPGMATFGARVAHGEPGSFYESDEKKNHPNKHVLPTIHPQKVQGLYGEDEDHPYDVWATPSGHGENSWDVIGEAGKHSKP